MTAWSRSVQREGVTIGFVPTMGALHEGHRALIRRARLTCDAVVVSLFVNPAQFGPREDYARYPRPFRQDSLICQAEGIDVLFAPNAEDIYPAGFQTHVAVPEISKRWEGEQRPQHFSGVATVVAKLFGIVRPDVSIFGQKDYQQVCVIRRLAADLNLGTTIVVHPTVREADGLALSSRNAYLTERQRRVAPLLYRALQAGEATVTRGISSGALVRQAMVRLIQQEPLIAIDYLAVCDPETLEPLHRIKRKAVLLGAIRVGEATTARTVRTVRLIDNLLVTRRAARRGA
jgi:pantoate--beta-alanine ligase